MYLIRDVLDQQIIDSKTIKVGKVDGLAMEVRAGEAPRISYLEVGNEPRARRLGLLALVRGRARTLRIPWNKIQHIGDAVTVDLIAEETDAYRVERWLCDNVIEKIPGNAHQKHQEKND